jgi:hypothetical protein
VRRQPQIFGNLHVGPIQQTAATSHLLNGRKMSCDLRL